jgi:hypothetical protein
MVTDTDTQPEAGTVHWGRSVLTKYAQEEGDLEASLAEIQRIKAEHRDYSVAPDAVRATTTMEIDDDGGITEDVAFEVKIPNGTVDERTVFAGEKTAHSQMAQKLGPDFSRYYRRMRKEHPVQLARDINYLLDHEAPEKGLYVRTLDGKVRAFLSDQFRTLDTHDLVFVAQPVIEDAGAMITRLELSADQFYLVALNPDWGERIDHQHRDVREEGAVFQQWLSESEEGYFHRYGAPARDIDDEDWVIGGMKLSNSETGRGGLNMSSFILRVGCMNGTTFEKTSATRHIGRKRTEDERGLIPVSDFTLDRERALIWSEIKDAVKFTFDRDRVHEFVAAMTEATTVSLGNAKRTMENIAVTYDFGEKEIKNIANRILLAQDPTIFGAVQAITAMAHEVEDAEKVDAYERVGAKLLTEGRKLVVAR